MMSTTVFEKNISSLDFSFKKEREESGVLLTEGYTKKNDLSPQELFALETAKEKFGANAVYFRFFQDGRGAIPQIYIYDNTQHQLTEKDKEDIYIKVWSGCQVPLFIIINKLDVKFFDAREKLDGDVNTLAFKTISLLGRTLELYNKVVFDPASFDNGLFWEDESNRNNFKLSTSAYRDLINGLNQVYQKFQQESKLDSHVSLKLLVQCLLIKYLEERDDENGYFSKTYFKRNFSCKNFCDVIRAGKLIDLLDLLAKDFNGKIFEWDLDHEFDQRKAIQQSSVARLAEYLDGDIDENKQIVLWRLYSFKSLPVELISSVYENLLTDSKDIVYTPEMLVSTLVDECMPLQSPKSNFKLIDVSCGSGIFLVKAYKRLIQWWRFEQWQQTGELVKPSLSKLKQLLTESIYGVDIEEDAIRLSVFSLALALLDEVNLDPPTWQRLKFPDLGDSNIINQDFFEFIANTPPTAFDLVIGNPPFNLRFVNGKEPDRKKYFEYLFIKYGYKSEIPIPDNNPALHFLIQTPKLLKNDAMLCLIQPSGPLLYQEDENFKRAVFSNYNLLQIIDFTKLADSLWGKRSFATAAVFLQKCTPNNEDVIHIIANNSFANNNKVFLELDHYDFHVVTKTDALNNINIWKVNLLGGGRLASLVNKFSKYDTLLNFLKTKRKNNQWVFGDGFIKGKADKDLTPSDFGKKKGGYTEAPYLTGSKYFDPEDFDESGISNIRTLKDKYFQWGRQEKLFKAPLLLIKKNIGVNNIPVIYSDKPIAFRNEVVGIHSPKSDGETLRKIENFIRSNSNLIRFYVSLTSSRAGISRSSSTILQRDILNIPFSLDQEAFKTSDVETILINEVLKYRITTGEKLLKNNVTEHQLKAFSKTFCQTLNSIYKAKGKEFSLYKILNAGSYYALHFEYTNKNFNSVIEISNDLEQYIKNIIPTQRAKYKSSHTQKILKVFGKDTLILAKPKQMRYWLQSIAFRDADETFADYFQSRLTDVKG